MLKFFKRFFCKHDLMFHRNIYGDEIIMSGYKRSIWKCRKCGALIYKGDLHADDAAMQAQAAQQPAGDVVRNAERYRFLAERCRSIGEHWGGRWSIVIDGPVPKTHDSEDDFDAAIDAAIAASGRQE